MTTLDNEWYKAFEAKKDIRYTVIEKITKFEVDREEDDMGEDDLEEYSEKVIEHALEHHLLVIDQCVTKYQEQLEELQQENIGNGLIDRKRKDLLHYLQHCMNMLKNIITLIKERQLNEHLQLDAEDLIRKIELILSNIVIQHVEDDDLFQIKRLEQRQKEEIEMEQLLEHINDVNTNDKNNEEENSEPNEEENSETSIGNQEGSIHSKTLKSHADRLNQLLGDTQEETNGQAADTENAHEEKRDKMTKDILNLTNALKNRAQTMLDHTKSSRKVIDDNQQAMDRNVKNSQLESNRLAVTAQSWWASMTDTIKKIIIIAVVVVFMVMFIRLFPK